MIVSVSEFLADHVRHEDIDGRKIRVVYDGVNTGHFDVGAVDRHVARQQYGIPQGAKVVLKIARLAPNKRIDLLLESFNILAQSMRDAILIVVGEPSGDFGHLAQLRQQLAGMDCRDRVRFLEFQSDIRTIECAAGVQVLCSENEPLGTCILESMSLGIPVVVSNAGGLKEVVEDGLSGFVVPAGDARALAERLERLLTDDALRERMGRTARRAIEARYSTEHCAEQMLRVYREVVSKWSAPQANSEGAGSAAGGGVPLR